MNPPKLRTCSKCPNTFYRVNGYRSLLCEECRKRPFIRVTKFELAKDHRTQRRILTEERGHRCEVCRLSEWNGLPIPLEIDHIDGDATNNANLNVRLICPNCHAQTPTYKAKNRGNGRHSRRQRYAAGLSY